MVHEQSRRADMPLVPVNCGALPEHLIESELFGHRKGAFTGADEHRTGLIQVADGGTLFLDEIGELPKAMQAKLLRFLESGEVRRVGDNESVRCDVRIVCATNRDLPAMVADGGFREDLWFRIDAFEVPLPPLRERVEDIPLLARHLAARFGMPRGDCPNLHVGKNGTVPLAAPLDASGDAVFTPQALEMLASHTWPGNVRELANVIEHAMILCDSPPIGPEHLPRQFSARSVAMPLRRASTVLNLQQLERQAIEDALDRHRGNKSKAAEELGVSVKTLYNKLNQFEELSKTA
jgi:transcriptional regulator with PAS, ATPase and Fis domain